MTLRLIPRREVLAFIALTGDESTMPRNISFREYTYKDGNEWHVVDITVDDAAAVRFWADAFGHPEDRLYRTDHTRADGSRWVQYRSQHTGWRGFTTTVEATVDLPAQEPLDADAEARLREIAGGDQ